MEMIRLTASIPVHKKGNAVTTALYGKEPRFRQAVKSAGAQASMHAALKRTVNYCSAVWGRPGLEQALWQGMHGSTERLQGCCVEARLGEHVTQVHSKQFQIGLIQAAEHIPSGDACVLLVQCLQSW